LVGGRQIYCNNKQAYFLSHPLRVTMIRWFLLFSTSNIIVIVTSVFEKSVLSKFEAVLFKHQLCPTTIVSLQDNAAALSLSLSRHTLKLCARKLFSV